MNAVSRERFTPATAADAVNPLCRACDGCGLSPHVLHKNAHGRTAHFMGRHPSYTEERTAYSFKSSVPAARKWIWRLVVICACVNARYIMFPHSIALGNRNPDIYASDQCMDSASWRYSTTAATVQISRQSRLFLATTAWEELRNIVPKKELKMNLSPPVICNKCDTTATDTLTTRFPVYRVSRRRRPRPESIRCILLLWAACATARRRISHTR